MALCIALLESAAIGDAASIERLLSTKSIDVDTVDENGCTALQRASADGHIDAVVVLLKYGANPNKQDIVHGNTAVHEASWKGYSKCVSILASYKANLHIRNFGGFAPLHLACQNGHNQSCRELLLAGTDPDIENNYGDTPLHTAARYGHAGVTRILISAECNVSDQNKNGDTALHIAAAMGRRKLTRILIEAGCDKHIKNMQNETPKDIATRKNLNEIIDILNNITGSKNKKNKKRDKSKESTDMTDSKVKKGIVRDKNDKTKRRPKTVHFEPAQQWSPYGCHYYPDPNSFPQPKLDSLPKEPLKTGEQYYLDLAGNIRKGPIGVGYTCYCAPFFKHMEDKLNKDKIELKQHIDEAHDRLDQKVSNLEMKTQGQLSELTRCVVAERVRCKERHKHLEQWLTRGIMFRASERVKRLDYSPQGSLDIAPMKRTRSLEILDNTEKDGNKIDKIIKKFNNEGNELNETRQTSRSAEMLDVNTPSTSRSSRHIQSRSNSRGHKSSNPSSMKSNDGSFASSSHTRSNHDTTDRGVDVAEIHIQNNNITITSQSPKASENDKYSRSPSQAYYRLDSENEPTQFSSRSTPQNSLWRSQVLNRTADDIKNRVRLEKELPNTAFINQPKSCFENIPQDGYIKMPKYDVRYDQGNVSENQRPTVQEIIAKVEDRNMLDVCNSPEPIMFPGRNIRPPSPSESQPVKILEQPLRPAPILKQQPPQKSPSKKFSFHNLIPFPTRKTFQIPSKTKPDKADSESSDEEDDPIRITTQPGLMCDSNLQAVPQQNYFQPRDYLHPPHYHQQRVIPKDAYFHELPQKSIPFNSEMVNPQKPIYSPNNNETTTQGMNIGRNRNPLYSSNGYLDAMMQEHLMTEMEKIPHHYSNQLDSHTEVEIANQHLGNYLYNQRDNYQHEHEILHSRLHSLAINTHLNDIQNQLDRESHNDSGYSTKMYGGSSQGPSPSLSGNVDMDNAMSTQRLSAILHSKTKSNSKPSQISNSSLV